MKLSDVQPSLQINDRDLLKNAIRALRSRSRRALEDYLAPEDWEDAERDVFDFAIMVSRALESILRCALCDGPTTVISARKKLEYFVSGGAGERNAKAMDTEHMKPEQLFVMSDYLSALIVLRYWQNQRVDILLADRLRQIVDGIFQQAGIDWPSSHVWKVKDIERVLIAGMSAELIRKNNSAVIALGEPTTELDATPCCLVALCADLAKMSVDPLCQEGAVIRDRMETVRHAWLQSAADALPDTSLYLVLLVFIAGGVSICQGENLEAYVNLLRRDRVKGSLS